MHSTVESESRLLIVSLKTTQDATRQDETKSHEGNLAFNFQRFVFEAGGLERALHSRSDMLSLFQLFWQSSILELVVFIVVSVPRRDMYLGLAA